MWNSNSTSSNIQNLAPGSYSVTVTDAKGCTIQSSAQITQPLQSLQLSETHANINCLGNGAGSIDLTVQGGTTPYSYNWSNGSTSQDVPFLPSGNYTVTVTDANNCSESLNISITQPAGSLQSSANVTDVLCFQGNNGAIDLNATMGTPPYSYVWSTGSTSQDLSNLAAGTYSVTITDANGCILANHFFVTEPNAALSGSFINTNVGCYGNSTGVIDLNTTGGTSPYSYSWSNGSTTEDLNNIAAGNYSVSITDDNGCTANLSTSISQPITALLIEPEITNINCHDIANGAINITVSGGTTPYTFLWSNGATNEDLSNLPIGTYTITVTDNNGCTASTSASVSSPAVLSTSAGTTSPLCYGAATASINLVVTGGTSPYNFIWNDAVSSEDRTGIRAGTYSVTVSDQNNCTTTRTIVVSQRA